MKFLRARASALGFATKSASSKKRSRVSSTSRITKAALMPSKYAEDDDDPYGDGQNDEDAEYDEEEDDNVDTDMLPTLLVYQSGELVYNWVRVDWEAGRGGIEEFLKTQVRFIPNYSFQLIHIVDIGCFPLFHLLEIVGSPRTTRMNLA